MLKRIMDLDPATRAPLRHELAARGGVQRFRARRAAGARVHGGVRPGALQPLRLHRGGVGDDRDPRGPARRAGHGRPALRPIPASRSSTTTGIRCRPAHRVTSSSAHEMLFEGYTDPTQEPGARGGHDDPGRPRPHRRAGPAVHRLARGRHDHLGRRERLPRPGRGGAAQRTPTSRTRSSWASRTSGSASDWSRSWCRAAGSELSERGGDALRPREPRPLQGPARGAPARRPAAQRARQGPAARIAPDRRDTKTRAAKEEVKWRTKRL